MIAAGLDPAQTGKITAALDEQGIAYELRNNGTALAVHEGAVVAGADRAGDGQGVAAGGGGTQPGYELLDESKLGASQFQQQLAAQRALEGEVARTLRTVEGVKNPTVRLVLPQDDMFQDEATPATAAVMLANPADTLQPGAVRGMAQVVASSVKGLKSENVTITDSAGQVLWPSEDSAGGTPGGSSKQSAEARYARQMESSLNAMLAADARPEQGPGQGQRRPQRRQDDAEGAHALRARRAGRDLRGDRDASRAARRPPAAPPARPATSRRTPRVPRAAGASRTTSAPRPTPSARSTRRSRRPRSLPARSTSSTSR